MLTLNYLFCCFVALSFFTKSGHAAPIFEDSTEVSHIEALDPRCQKAKEGQSQDILKHCPKGTVFVSHKHPQANFWSISSALESLPDNGKPRTILIDAGNYHEKVVVTRRSPIVFAGVTSNFRKHNVEKSYSNRVHIWQSTYVNQSDPYNKLNNCDAVVLSVGNGSYPGSTDFKAYNIDFTQRQIQNGVEITDHQLGPAAALCVLRSNASFYGCSFNSYQDTIYVSPDSKAMFFKSIVRGTTDQLYGMGQAWFEKVRLLSRGCKGGITAWRGDPQNTRIGVYISNSEIARSDDAPSTKNLTGKCHLGRPWNIYSHATYLNTKMSDIVNATGFKVWSKNASQFDPKLTKFEEYNSYGPGGNLQGRDLLLDNILTDDEANKITWRNVFGSTPWLDEKTLKS
ncbi:uncharacterized protein MEPE_04708 [Melanopsichium pennsylvanicum]|uniref:pectinesterase n=2 Tax=Melanopsichium pennsylvanicum TaxID=63383 RepID=A0AAJ4XP93_9BASI|nr:carbohydrate esterase family 8 protein [Melanopsichium pennsylvanicum 4]SNX85999.1 uncharacterized protein MEPE_04708 [Melanopsichium pennsylvanicum]